MHPLSRHQACAYDGKVYVFGGFDGTSKFNNLSIYNVETKSWSFPPILGGTTPKPRSNHACAIVQDKLCVDLNLSPPGFAFFFFLAKVLPICNVSYLFGGNNQHDTGKYQVLDDFFCLDLSMF